MAVMVWISALICVYIATFREEFKEEDLQKALPLIVIVLVVTVLSAFIA